MVLAHDIRISNGLFQNLMVIEIIAVFFAFFGLALSIVLFEFKKLKNISD